MALSHKMDYKLYNDDLYMACLVTMGMCQHGSTSSTFLKNTDLSGVQPQVG